MTDKTLKYMTDGLDAIGDVLGLLNEGIIERKKEDGNNYITLTEKGLEFAKKPDDDPEKIALLKKLKKYKGPLEMGDGIEY